jgi:hypothetical protein
VRAAAAPGKARLLLRSGLAVTPDMTVRAARAVEALMARHAELREVLDHWAGALAAAADSGRPVRPVRNLLEPSSPTRCYRIPVPRSARCTGQPGATRTPGCGFLTRLKKLIEEPLDIVP